MSVVIGIKQVVLRALLKRKFPTSVIHRGARIDFESVLMPYSVIFYGSSITSSVIGRFTYIQRNSCIYQSEIGPFCSIASCVSVGLVSHPMTGVSTSPVFYDSTQPLPKFFTDMRPAPKCARTSIGADVWIGEGVKIRAGVRVGEGAVIGAGAIVTRDIEPYAIAGGVPCRKIRSRFSDALVYRLRASRWWELDEAVLKELAPSFDRPEEFLNRLPRL